jgi:hypothetical protein
MVNDDFRPDLRFRPNRKTKRMMWIVAVVAGVILLLGLAYAWFAPRLPVPDTPTTPPVQTRTPDTPRPSPGTPAEPALPAPQR